MSLARPSRVWRYAGLATIFSVLGGILGYLLGLWFYQILAAPLLGFYGVEEEYSHAVDWFETYGVWVVFLAGITPIPYKVFTIGAGSLQMAWLPFLVASTLGRGLRFFALAGTLHWGGEWLLRQTERWGPALFWMGILALAGMVIHSFLFAD